MNKICYSVGWHGEKWEHGVDLVVETASEPAVADTAEHIL